MPLPLRSSSVPRRDDRSSRSDRTDASGKRPETAEQPPKTATIEILIPNAKAELVVRGEVGRGNPDEWYGSKRVVHSPPMHKAADYLIGSFCLEAAGLPLTRTCPIRIEPGKAYEVDLRLEQPISREIPKLLGVRRSGGQCGGRATLASGMALAGTFAAAGGVMRGGSPKALRFSASVMSARGLRITISPSRIPSLTSTC